MSSRCDTTRMRSWTPAKRERALRFSAEEVVGSVHLQRLVALDVRGILVRKQIARACSLLATQAPHLDAVHADGGEGEGEGGLRALQATAAPAASGPRGKRPGGGRCRSTSSRRVRE